MRKGITDWRMLGQIRAVRDCQKLRAEVAKAERAMALVKDYDRPAYLRLGLLHARLMRTLGRKERERSK